MLPFMLRRHAGDCWVRGAGRAVEAASGGEGEGGGKEVWGRRGFPCREDLRRKAAPAVTSRGRELIRPGTPAVLFLGPSKSPQMFAARLQPAHFPQTASCGMRKRGFCRPAFGETADSLPSLSPFRPFYFPACLSLCVSCSLLFLPVFSLLCPPPSLPPDSVKSEAKRS